MKLLIATDGSTHALRAVRHAASLQPLVAGLEAHLLHVLSPIDSWEVRSHLDTEDIEEIRREQAEQALRDAKQALREAGVAFEAHIREGDVPEEIARLAEELGCQQILMGCRGMGALGGVLLGSVSTKVLHRVDIPVTLVK